MKYMINQLVTAYLYDRCKDELVKTIHVFRVCEILFANKNFSTGCAYWAIDVKTKIGYNFWEVDIISGVDNKEALIEVL